MGFDPLTWGIIIGSVGIVAGAAGSTVGAITNHQQQQANADAQEAAMRANAKQEELEAAAVQQETNEQERRQRAEAERLRSMQLSLLGKSGVAATTGSPLAVLGETAGNQEMENLDLRRTGAINRDRHYSAAENYKYQGRLAAGSVSKGSLYASLAGGAGNALSSGVSAYGTGVELYKKFK